MTADKAKIQTALDALWDLEGIIPQEDIMAMTGPLIVRRVELS